MNSDDENDNDDDGIDYIDSDDDDENNNNDSSSSSNGRGYKFDDVTRDTFKTKKHLLSNPSFTSSLTGIQRSKAMVENKTQNDLAQVLHVDDLSSDDEDNGDKKNTIGRVPLHWYDEYDHIGYDTTGQKIIRKKGRSEIDEALAKKDDPMYFRTVYDAVNDKEHVLTDREMEILRRIQAGAVAHPEHDAYPEYIDYYSSEKAKQPLLMMPEPKARFLPSKWEWQKVMKIAQGITTGKIQFKDQEEEGGETESFGIVYDMER